MASETNNPRGRPKGIVNKLVDELRNSLLYDEQGNLIKENHPAFFLSEIMKDDTKLIEHRIDAAKALLPYLQPKLKQMEISGVNGEPLQVEGVSFKVKRPQKPDEDSDE